MSLKHRAQEVLSIVNEGRYRAGDVIVRIGAEVQTSLDGTLLYTAEDIEQIRVRTAIDSLLEISVVDGTTQVVAQHLCNSGEPVALLNFASARNPGGGFLNGAKAQEEDLCRCSALYPTLISKMEYYETNRSFESALYTDCLIYSPKVPFIKVSGAGNYLETPFLVDVITAPAPNSRAYLKRNNDLGRLEETFLRRWENVLAVAREQKVESLLLGAWGCGAFGGDPEMASRTAKEAIRTYGYSFEKIVFAIPNTGKRSAANFDVFKKAFR